MLHPDKIWVCSHTRCRWVECALRHNSIQYEWARVHKVYGHKYMQAVPWNFPYKNLLLHWRNSAFSQGFFTYYLLSWFFLSCKLPPDSQLLWLRLRNWMLVEKKGFRQEIWKHRIVPLMDQSSYRPFFPLWPEPMLQEMMQILSYLTPELILISDSDKHKMYYFFFLIHLFLSVVTKHIFNIYKVIYVHLSAHTKLWPV